MFIKSLIQDLEGKGDPFNQNFMIHLKIVNNNPQRFPVFMRPAVNIINNLPQGDDMLYTSKQIYKYLTKDIVFQPPITLSKPGVK